MATKDKNTKKSMGHRRSRRKKTLNEKRQAKKAKQ